MGNKAYPPTGCRKSCPWDTGVGKDIKENKVKLLLTVRNYFLKKVYRYQNPSRKPDQGNTWTDEEWEYEKNGTWDKGACQWDEDDGGWDDYKGDKKCHCKAFKHPNAPRRREAVEHSRNLS